MKTANISYAVNRGPLRSVVGFVSVALLVSVSALAQIGIESGGGYKSNWGWVILPGATGSACAYSLVVPGGSNKALWHNGLRVSAGPVCSFPVPPLNFPNGRGDLNIAKPPMSDNWQSGTLSAKKTWAWGYGDFSPIPWGVGQLLYVAADVTPSPPPEFALAAGYAADPVTVLPGTYNYSVEINNIRLSTGGTPYGAELVLDATSSLYPNAYLWRLRLSVGPSGNLTAEFTSAPVLGLNDAAILNAFLANLSRPNSYAYEATGSYMLFETQFTESQAWEINEEAAAAVHPLGPSN